MVITELPVQAAWERLGAGLVLPSALSRTDRWIRHAKQERILYTQSHSIRTRSLYQSTAHNAMFWTKQHKLQDERCAMGFVGRKLIPLLCDSGSSVTECQKRFKTSFEQTSQSDRHKFHLKVGNTFARWLAHRTGNK